MSKEKKRPRGRPIATKELPEYESMDEMSMATGIPLPEIKKAKRLGCPFVKHGRPNLHEFLIWYFENNLTEEESVNWSQRDKRAAALIKEEDLMKKRKETIAFAQATAFANHMVNKFFFAELDRLAQEFPPNLKGKDEISIHAECLKQVEVIKSGLADHLAQLKKGEIETE